MDEQPNGTPPKVVGQIVINLLDNGTANMQVQAQAGPFTIYNALHNLAESFRGQAAATEQQAIKVQLPPAGIDLTKLRGLR